MKAEQQHELTAKKDDTGVALKSLGTLVAERLLRKKEELEFARAGPDVRAAQDRAWTVFVRQPDRGIAQCKDVNF
jgi:hypothetical protein